MKRYKNIKAARVALLLCIAVFVASAAATSCFAASLNVLRFNRRNADTSDVPPIGEGLESSAEDIVDGIGDGAETVVDGAESFWNTLGTVRIRTKKEGRYEELVKDKEFEFIWKK